MISDPSVPVDEHTPRIPACHLPHGTPGGGGYRACNQSVREVNLKTSFLFSFVEGNLRYVVRGPVCTAARSRSRSRVDPLPSPYAACVLRWLKLRPAGSGQVYARARTYCTCTAAAIIDPPRERRQYGITIESATRNNQHERPCFVKGERKKKKGAVMASDFFYMLALYMSLIANLAFHV